VRTADESARTLTLAPPPRTRLRRLALFATLGAAAVYGPATMDINLPALPAIQDDLGTTVSGAQLTMTSYLLGLAIGQVVVGAFSDALGRRAPFVVGLLVFSVASAACAAAPNIAILVLLRALQGVGAATGVVTVRAVVRDMYGGERAASYLSRLVLLIGLAPVLAPSVGAQILSTTSWRGIFVALAAFGLMTLALTALVIPETLPRSARRPLHPRSMTTGFVDLLRRRDFVGYILASGLASATMITMITGSTFALQDDYDLTAREFGVVFGIGAVTMIVVAQVNASLVRIVHPRVSTIACSSLTGVVCLAAAAASAFGMGPVPICIALVCALGTWGLVAPNTTALALADHPRAAGSASALVGLAQFGLAGLIAPVTGLVGAGAVAIGVVTASLSFGAAAALRLLTPVAARGSRAHSQLSAEPARTP
jgi:DHA1 family bicyclomycin/chloramphenicol resistance-like MFS transporter